MISNQRLTLFLRIVVLLATVFVLSACTLLDELLLLRADSDRAETTIELRESVNVTDAMGGTLTVNYPAAWQLLSEMDGTGVISLNGTDSSQVLTLSFFPELIFSSLGDNPAEILQLQTDPLVNALPDADISEILAMELEGRPAASRLIDISGIETLYYIVQIEGGYVLAIAINIDAAIVEAILAKVDYHE